MLQDAEPGIRSHGYITGIKPYGIFVSFFGGMKGLAHTAELPLAPDQTPKDAYQVGQVVKCRVMSTDFSHQRLKLSLMGKKSGAEGAAAGGEEGTEGADPLGGLQPGDIVEGSVREIEAAEVWHDWTRFNNIQLPGMTYTALIILPNLLDSRTGCTLWSVGQRLHFTTFLYTDVCGHWA